MAVVAVACDVQPPSYHHEMAGTRTKAPESDAVLDAIEDLLASLNRICEPRTKIGRRASLIRRRRELGDPYSVIVPDEEPPLIIERAREGLNDLIVAAGRLQRAEAQALYAEGMSMDRIGALFGVSRQRVADFVRHASASLEV